MLQCPAGYTPSGPQKSPMYGTGISTLECYKLVKVETDTYGAITPVMQQSNCTDTDLPTGYVASRQFTANRSVTQTESKSEESGHSVGVEVGAEASLPIAKAVTASAKGSYGYEWKASSTKGTSVTDENAMSITSTTSASPMVKPKRKIIGYPGHDTIYYQRAVVSYAPNGTLFNGTTYSSGQVVNPNGNLVWVGRPANCQG